MPQLGEIKRAKEIGLPGNQSVPHMWAACIVCGKERWVQAPGGKLRHRKCLACGCKTGRYGVGGEHPTGENSSNWKGGLSKTTDGYITVRLEPDDFFYLMTCDGYIREHRLVMAKHLNRCLLSWEIVHHRNGDKTDNSLENLKLLTRVYHIPDIQIKALVKRQQREIQDLQGRVTILEAENILLRTSEFSDKFSLE